MLKSFLFNYYNSKINKVYTQNINNLGYIPNGVFWNSTNSQFSRFEFLVKLIKQNSEGILSNIADVGCGYGAFLNFLLLNKVKFKKYRGYDINPKLIQFCKRNYPNYLFFINHAPIKKCDFSIMSGTYNFSITENVSRWENYILLNLEDCYKVSERGIIFNLQFSNISMIKNKIYYTNSKEMIKKLKLKFGNVEQFYDTKTKNDVYFLIKKS